MNYDIYYPDMNYGWADQYTHVPEYEPMWTSEDMVYNAQTAYDAVPATVEHKYGTVYDSTEKSVATPFMYSNSKEYRYAWSPGQYLGKFLGGATSGATSLVDSFQKMMLMAFIGIAALVALIVVGVVVAKSV